MQPPGAEIQVFGSRVTGIGLKPHSDLDLLIVGPDKLPLLLGVLRNALTEPDLLFSVDIVEAQDAESKLLASLKELCNLELRLASEIK